MLQCRFDIKVLNVLRIELGSSGGEKCRHGKERVWIRNVWKCPWLKVRRNINDSNELKSSK